MPGLTSAPSEGLLSSTIFTGTRWTTLVKFPVALSGGSSAKVLPVPGDQTVHVAGELEVGKGVDSHAGRLADADVGHLRFLEVRKRPDVRQRKDGDHLRADIDELAEAHLPLAHEAIGGRQNSRIAQIVRGERDLRLRCVDLGAKLLLLNVDRRQRRLLLVELRFVQAPLRDRFRRVGVGLFDQLLRAGDSGLVQVALALILELIAQHVGLGRVDRRLGLPDERLLDGALVLEIGERGLSRGEIGLSQVKLGLVVGRIDDRDQIALADGLEVVDRHFRDVSGHARGERRHVARDEGVVRRFETRRARPAVPVPCGVPDEPGGEDEEGDAEDRIEPVAAPGWGRGGGLR